jgi:hypothetical protein
MFINDEIQRQVLPIIAKATVSPPGDVQERASSQLQMNPGQQVKAEIIANLPNSLYLARIGRELFKLEIPLNVQPGETLEMTYVSAEPRISFQVLRPEGAGESVQLSSMGKFLSDVVKGAPPLPPPKEPLLESPAQGTAMLAAKLKTALTQGGLFYESHLARWAAGALPLAELLKQPQGKLSRLLSGQAPLDETEENAAAEYADSRTLPLIKEQLHLLNSGVLSWKGEAWPDQGVELSVTRKEADDNEPEIEATLKLNLSRMGGVEAKVRFGPEGLFIDFVCERPGSSAVLREGGDELRDALASKGLHLTRMVAKDGEADD